MKKNLSIHSSHTFPFSFRLPPTNKLTSPLSSHQQPLSPPFSSPFLLFFCSYTHSSIPLVSQHGQPCLWPVACASQTMHGKVPPPLFFHTCHAKGEGEETSFLGPPSLLKGSTSILSNNFKYRI